MNTLQEHQVTLTAQQILLINYAIKELARENRKYPDDFASSLLVEYSEEILEKLKTQFYFIKK